MLPSWASRSGAPAHAKTSARVMPTIASCAARGVAQPPLSTTTMNPNKLISQQADQPVRENRRPLRFSGNIDDIFTGRVDANIGDANELFGLGFSKQGLQCGDRIVRSGRWRQGDDTAHLSSMEPSGNPHKRLPYPSFIDPS